MKNFFLPVISVSIFSMTCVNVSIASEEQINISQSNNITQPAPSSDERETYQNLSASLLGLSDNMRTQNKGKLSKPEINQYILQFKKIHWQFDNNISHIYDRSGFDDAYYVYIEKRMSTIAQSFLLEENEDFILVSTTDRIEKLGEAIAQDLQ